MREEFEKLPEIAEKLRMCEWFYSDHLDCYMVEGSYAGFINGAYYAYQEQQKKINTAIEYLDSIEGSVWYEQIKDILK